jgi:hypothetical protein
MRSIASRLGRFLAQGFQRGMFAGFVDFRDDGGDGIADARYLGQPPFLYEPVQRLGA